MKEMSKGAVAIIGGADGPTSVFVAGRIKRIPFKHRVKNRIYKWKSKRAAKQIFASPRSLAEVIAYAVNKYDARKVEEADFHLYEINFEDGRLEMEVDYRRNALGISYSGKKKAVKRMQEIARDLYLYYGVSEEDICEKSERYHSLLAMLSM